MKALVPHEVENEQTLRIITKLEFGDIIVVSSCIQ